MKKDARRMLVVDRVIARLFVTFEPPLCRT